jgi:uridine phosphorylase
MINLSNSELILNPNGSIYHLHLLPEDIASTVLLVGDPERVEKVSKYFDKVELKKRHREFVTHTGTVGTKRISVISTGIGTDNIDIVLNELDALVNIDFNTRTIKPNHISLDIIRLGTSGSIQKAINVDSLLISEYAIGLDSLMSFYNFNGVKELSQVIDKQANKLWDISHFYTSKRSLFLNDESKFLKGITLTCPGFYAPQNRSIRLDSKMKTILDSLTQVDYENLTISNMEMETAGIYGLSSLLGHKALSVNAILANRVTNEFSSKPDETVERMIKEVISLLS